MAPEPAALGLVPALLLLLVACMGDEAAPDVLGVGEPEVTLDVRPVPGGGACAPGTHDLELSTGRKALLHVSPPGRGRQRGLLLALHGAGSGGARGGLWIFRAAWNVPGIAIVAPAAAATTWTLERRDLGFVERALRRAFARCRIDARRVAVGGFSAGAGLALWLGLANGNLFHDVIALSAGGALPRAREGRPRIFLAHGTRDGVIPIQYGGDAIARELRADGYRARYVRFDGGHRVRAALARRALVRALRLRGTDG